MKSLPLAEQWIEALVKHMSSWVYPGNEAQFEILDLPKKGFLGLGASPAKVRVFIEVSKAQCAVDYLQSIFTRWGWIKYRLT